MTDKPPAAAPGPVTEAGSEYGLPTWPEGRFVGRQQFENLVVQGLLQAAASASALVWLCDPDFADWPLGQRPLVDALDAWAVATRGHPLAQLRMLAQSYDDMRVRHARFVTWRARWSHRVEVRIWSAGQAKLPSVLWTPQWSLQRVDDTRDVVVATVDAAQRKRLDERLQPCWGQGRPAFPVTSLGL